ncbi:SCP2 sterol-binding domain-containing protein [Paenalkalicoccus suaedae]|uniref:SCP2 sterol-binding domain-containing protein n=1 Tax=Paenalkalicoccus suaedae TaxID=2592382 RepID=A0A859FDB6_9BACI|nr:SCP2 sterol-binding domain-containing protein [Paenalkalicoccus suaedae]QKS70574.1 SCP2 sterol-binding domain-containing protein [Paenalkalicoccus suaedae]
MQAEQKMQEVVTKMNTNPEHIQDLTYTYEFRLTDSGVRQLHIENGKAELTEPTREPKLVIEISDENFVKMANDDLNPTTAYMTGKLKIKGEIGHALKFSQLLKKYQ